MNRRRIDYLIVTESALIVEPEHIEILDRSPAHIQITVICLDNKEVSTYEKASPSSQWILAIRELQESGFDVSMRLSPAIEESMDFDILDSFDTERCVIEFLRINT